TMSEDQCLAGAWGQVGYADGAAGYAMSRLNEHVEACAKYGVAPEEAVYMSARADGLRQYCTPANGFRAGRTGGSYAGVCPAHLERDFLPAFRDGETVHVAYAAVEAAQNAINSARDRVRDRQEKLDGFQRDLGRSDVSDDEKDRIRNRMRDMRREIEDARRDERRADGEMRDAERDYRDVRLHFTQYYGSW
ncbi:MAG: DUF2799 domain-containing protein, partial [Brevundimonas sp.]